MKDYQTKWWEHVERVGDQQIPKILFKYEYNPQDKRSRRPEKRQKNEFFI
jgi:hypothetical protein